MQQHHHTIKQKITAAALTLLLSLYGSLMAFADEIDEKKDELSGHTRKRGKRDNCSRDESCRQF